MYMVYNIIPLVQLSFKAIGRYINYIYERSIELRSNTKAESPVWYLYDNDTRYPFDREWVKSLVCAIPHVIVFGKAIKSHSMER